MDWGNLIYDMGYVVTAILTVYLSGWLIYDKLATSEYSLSKALFEDRNFAAGLEVAGFLFVEILIAVSAMSGDEVVKMNDAGIMVTDYYRDLEAVAVTILFCNLTFFLFRWVASQVLRWRFRGKLDAHGEEVRFNNEIFGQKNLGASLFSISYLLVMYFMILQEDFLGTQLYQVESYFNMLSVFLTGLVVYFLHNLVFLDRGHTTLEELFIDNNSGVGLSLVGFMFTVLFLQSRLITQFGQGEHFFNSSSDTYTYFVLLLVFIVLFRKVFTVALGIFTGRSFQKDFLVEDNPVAGLLDFAFVSSTGMLLGIIL
jgi:hypothetical protein